MTFGRLCFYVWKLLTDLRGLNEKLYLKKDAREMCSPGSAPPPGVYPPVTLILCHFLLVSIIFYIEAFFVVVDQTVNLEKQIINSLPSLYSFLRT